MDREVRYAMTVSFAAIILLLIAVPCVLALLPGKEQRDPAEEE